MSRQPDEAPQQPFRQQRNRPVWAGLGGAIILVVGLTALFAFEPWDTSEKSEQSTSKNQSDGRERADLPRDLCEFVMDGTLEIVVSTPRETIPRSRSTIVGKYVSCDAESDSGRSPFLVFDVERADSSHSHDDVKGNFRESCVDLKEETSSNGNVELLPTTDSSDICGNIVHVPESDIVEMEVYAIDQKDIISVNYTVTAATAAEVEQAGQDILTFVDDLTKKLRE